MRVACEPGADLSPRHLQAAPGCQRDRAHAWFLGHGAGRVRAPAAQPAQPGATYFDGRTCVSPSDDFARIGPALGAQDVAIVIPWHGAITLGKDLATASALHVTFDYAARLDVTLPAHTPVMPAELVAEVQAVLARTTYLAVTWDLICRKGRDSFDGKRVIPGLPN